MTHEAIRVGVRLRPLVSHEKGQSSCLAISDSDVSVITSSLPNGDKVNHGPWRFDYALDSSNIASENYISNAKMYDSVGRRIVQHALEGFNACVLTYGQTGTGKTTTVLGDSQAGPGLLILLLKDLFQHKSQEESRGDSVNIAIQMLEVYNETIFDLLQGAGQHGRDHRHGNNSSSNVELLVLPTGVQIKGAQSKFVGSVEECQRLIEHGNRRKHIASTAMNPNSSRGHTVFKLVIQRDHVDEGVHMRSDIYFADLAGHDDEKTTKVTGDRLVELSFINKSLMWLQSAIQAIASKGKHAHGTSGAHAHRHHKHDMALFWNSKLTLLLSNALLGNSLVDIIATVSPAAAQFSASLSSLTFVNEVKHISVDVHSSEPIDPPMQVHELHAQVKHLQEQLKLALSGVDSAVATCNACAPSEFKTGADAGVLASAKIEAEEKLVVATPAENEKFQKDIQDSKSRFNQVMLEKRSLSEARDCLKLEENIWQTNEALTDENERLRTALQKFSVHNETLMFENGSLAKDLNDFLQKFQASVVELEKLRTNVRESREREEELVVENRSLALALQGFVSRSLADLNSKFDQISSREEMEELFISQVFTPMFSEMSQKSKHSEKEVLPPSFPSSLHPSASPSSQSDQHPSVIPPDYKQQCVAYISARTPPASQRSVSLSESLQSLPRSLRASHPTVIPPEAQRQRVSHARSSSPPQSVQCSTSRRAISPLRAHSPVRRMASPPTPQHPRSQCANSPLPPGPLLQLIRSASPHGSASLPAATSVPGVVRVGSSSSVAVPNASPGRTHCSTATNLQVQQQMTSHMQICSTSSKPQLQQQIRSSMLKSSIPSNAQLQQQNIRDTLSRSTPQLQQQNVHDTLSRSAPRNGTTTI